MLKYLEEITITNVMGTEPLITPAPEVLLLIGKFKSSIIGPKIDGVFYALNLITREEFVSSALNMGELNATLVDNLSGYDAVILGIIDDGGNLDLNTLYCNRVEPIGFQTFYKVAADGLLEMTSQILEEPTVLDVEAFEDE